MDASTVFLLDLGIFAGIGLFFSLIFAMLKLPVVSALIIGGMIAGPNVLGWVKDPVVINDLAAIGIVLLLFIIGLELDPVQLRKMVLRIGAAAALEMSLAFVVGFAAAYYLLGVDLPGSLIFAMVASITSTAIVGKVFLERGRRALRDSAEPGALMGIMVLEDMVAVIFLILLTSITSGSPLSTGSLSKVVVTLAGGVALIVGGYLVATFIAPRAIDFLGAFEEEYEEIPFLFALGVAFFFAVLAAVLGYSPGLGAFIIGLSIRGKRSKFLEKRVTTIKDLFVLLFFMSMGSLIDPVPAILIGLPLVGLMAAVIASKSVGGYVAANAFLHSDSPKKSFLFGAWLVPRGEFSFVIGQLALSLGVIDVRLFSLIGLVVLVTAIVGPIMQKFGERKSAPAIFPTRAAADTA